MTIFSRSYIMTHFVKPWFSSEDVIRVYVA